MKFYRLRDDEKYPDADWDMDKVELGTIYCPTNPGHQRAGDRLNDLTIVLPSPRIGDFIWTCLTECIVTEKVVEVFKREGLTGYTLAPVSVSKIERGNKDLSRLPKLWELKLIGWAGMAGKKSGIRLLRECKACGSLRYSTYVDASELIVPKRWDGSDIFMVWPMPRYVFVTERVREVVLEAKLTGCELIPVEELESPLKWGIDGLSPGRLRSWMPDARARELGEPLGIY